MRRYLKYLAVALLVVYLVFFRFADDIGHDRGPDDRFRVTRVVDGDTFELTGGDMVRLIGIDCPERGEPYYDSARMLLEKLSLEQMVSIQHSHRRRDGYGRILGYVYIDNAFINQDLVRNGYAHVYLFDDNIKDTLQINGLLSAQKEAINDKIGIWSIERNEESVYYANPRTYRFHRPGCSSVQKSNNLDKFKKFNNRLDPFMEGYSPCRNCKP